MTKKQNCDTLTITAIGHMRVQPPLLINRSNSTIISYHHHHTINGDTVVPVPYLLNLLLILFIIR